MEYREPALSDGELDTLGALDDSVVRLKCWRNPLGQEGVNLLRGTADKALGIEPGAVERGTVSRAGLC